jgi:putative tryptophan/tyrosine transport system substrate-binding protein
MVTSLARVVRFLAACFVILIAITKSASSAELPRVGMLWPGDVARWNNAFIEGLRENGFTDGVNATFHIRATGQKLDSGASLAKELVALNPDVLYVSPGILAKQAIEELERSKKNIPVVVLSSDPVAEGLVPAAARHGKNITGLAARPGAEMSSKHLQLIRELLPRATKIAYMMDTSWYATSYFSTAFKIAEKTGREIGISVIPVEVPGPQQLDAKFAEAAQKQAQAIILPGGPTFAGNRDRVVALAFKHRLPTIYGDELYAYSGGLIAYGTSIAEIQRRAGSLVARILRGAKAADIPVEYPTRFRLIINMPAAISLGLEIPQSVVLLADEIVR